MTEVDIDEIGFAGIGLMGGPMSRRLAASRKLVAWNRTAAKASELAAAAPEGAVRVAAAPKELAACDVVLLMLIDDAAAHEVLLGPEGVFAADERPKIVVNMSTIGILAAETLRAACEERGVAYVSSPVSGSTAYAADGQLTIIASGPPEAVEAVTPLLDELGKQTLVVGTGTQANLAKLCVNLIIGATNQALAESLAMGLKGGIDEETLLGVLESSVIVSPWLRYKVRQLIDHDFTPGHTLHGLNKDWWLMEEASRVLEAPLPVTALVHQKIRAAVGHGHGELDMIAVLKDAYRAAGLDG